MPAARLFYGVLICFTCPAITVATIILRALDRVRERVLGSAPTAIFYRFTPGGLSVTFGSRILCDLDPALVMLLHCTVPGVDIGIVQGFWFCFPSGTSKAGRPHWRRRVSWVGCVASGVNIRNITCSSHQPPQLGCHGPTSCRRPPRSGYSFSGAWRRRPEAS